MREGTDGNEIEAERSNLLCTFERHVAGTFHEHLVTAFLDDFQGFGHHFVAHVVEHDDVHAFIQKRTELVEVFDFHLDHQALLVVLLDNFKRFENATGCCNVIVLHEHHVKEAHAMIGTATDANSVLLQSAESRNRLASVEHFRLAALQSFLERMSNRYYLTASVFLLAATSQGLLISTVCRDQTIASSIALLSSFLPNFIFSGVLFEIDAMPLVLRALSYLFPARYYASSLQTIFMVGDAWTFLVKNMAAIGALASILLVATVVKTRSRLE